MPLGMVCHICAAKVRCANISCGLSVLQACFITLITAPSDHHYVVSSVLRSNPQLCDTYRAVYLPWVTVILRALRKLTVTLTILPR